MYPKQVSENKVRVISSIVSILSILSFIFTPIIMFFILSFLLIDFILRAFIHPQKSLLFKFTEILKIKDFEMIPSYGKQFSDTLGFSIVLLSLIFVFSIPFLSNILILILAVFTFMESVFNFCVGCKLYYFLIEKGILNKPNPLN